MTTPQKFTDIIIELLSSPPGRQLTAGEIADLIVASYPEFCARKKATTVAKTDEALRAQINSEIGARYANDSFRRRVGRTADTPHRYFLQPAVITAPPEISPPRGNDRPDTAALRGEARLYPLLARYCRTLNIHTLRINEKVSRKQEETRNNIWLHADVVGFKDTIAAYTEDTRTAVSAMRATGIGLMYSFEVKGEIIKPGRLRSYFFQTVSNSSWAHYSYLVAPGIEREAEDELRLLCASFKIGFIQLDERDPETASRILVDAPRTDLDWDMINRIAEVNPDFGQYLKNINLISKGYDDPNYQPPKWDLDF